MARTVFDGPILCGLNRMGPTRDVGYTDLVQTCDFNFTNTISGTAGYSGASAQFVWGNAIPNVPGNLYTPQAGAFSAAGPTIVAPTADTVGTAGNLYRGAVMYLPAGASINDILIDCGVVPTISGGTIGTITVGVGNQFNGTQYASVASVSAVGRQSLAAFTDAQYVAQSSTTQDFQNPVIGQQPTWFSQVVFTVTIPFTVAQGVLTAGKFYFTVRYSQADGNIGTATVYPNGNFD